MFNISKFNLKCKRNQLSDNKLSKILNCQPNGLTMAFVNREIIRQRFQFNQLAG